QDFTARVIAEHLPFTRRATVGGDEVDIAAVIPAAFTPAESRATQGQTTVVAASLFRRGNVDPLGVPGHALGEARVLPALAAEVELVLALDRQHLQPATLGQVAILVGDETVEAAGAGVFRLIDNAGDRIDGDRFVGETAHVLQGNGLGRAIAGYLEDEAMGHAGDGSRGFFTGEPGAPGSQAAGTVGGGAADAHIRRQPFT